MLPPFIIEQIRQRENQKQLRQESTRPRLELPIEPIPLTPSASTAEEESDRGVVVLDLLG